MLNSTLPVTDATCTRCLKRKLARKPYLAEITCQNLPYVCLQCRERARREKPLAQSLASLGVLR